METLTIKRGYNKVNLPFSSKDDEVILSAVKRNPSSLSGAFKIAAEQLNRTADSISGRWYGKLKKAYAHGKTNAPAVVDKGRYAPVVNLQGTESLRMEVLKDMLSKLTSDEKRSVVSYILEL